MEGRRLISGSALALRATHFAIVSLVVPVVLLGCRPTMGPWTAFNSPNANSPPPVSLASGQAPAPPPPQAYIQELSQRLQAANDEIRSLEARLAYREEKIEEKSRELQLALKEIQAAQNELSQAREEIERLRRDNAQLQARIEASEKQNREHLQTIATLLQRLMERDRAAPTPR
ncbi:MAG: hypothetical protein RMI91_13115 [Gemmatales bacterium]|nr:hypothetical protein [Gemmatales bacterium]MDW7995584.1 hypothetical protein [Gemmatales bacterium]